MPRRRTGGGLSEEKSARSGSTGGDGEDFRGRVLELIASLLNGSPESPGASGGHRVSARVEGIIPTGPRVVRGRWGPEPKKFRPIRLTTQPVDPQQLGILLIDSVGEIIADSISDPKS